VINLPTEEDTNVNTVLWPDRKWIYTYRLIEASSDKKWTYPAQYIYVKPINGVLSLCNQKWDAIWQQKILLPGTNDYYNLSVNADSFQLGWKEKELQSRRPTLVDKRWDKLPTTSCSFLAPLSETKTLYRFTNSELSLRDVMTIEVDQPKDGAITLSWEDKLANLAAFQTLDTTKSGIASYRDLFDTNNTVYQALRHSDYETTFSTLYQTYAKTEKTDDLVQMKVLDKQSGKRYYKPYHISKDKDGKFVMTESPGRQKTYDVMRQRLDRIAEAHKIALMQEKSLDPKGNTMRWWYTTNPIAKSLQDYLQDDKKPIEFTLRTNHKQWGEYEKHTLYYSPQKDTISFSSDKQESSKTIEDINYSISFNKKDMGIVIKKGTYTPSGW